MLLGRNGQVGWELHRQLQTTVETHAFGSRELDITDSRRLTDAVRDLRPQIIVNAAAYTAVDRAESEPERAMQINGVAPGIVAEAARSIGAVLIHFSTDYVFDGTKGRPYAEGDAPDPVNVYGRSKLAGETAIQSTEGAHLILRSSWIYSLRRDCYLTRTLERARQQEVMRVVHAQIGNPTWARSLAQAVCVILGRGADFLKQNRGLYHLAGDGYASRLEWTQAILELDPRRSEQIVRELVPASAAEFSGAAQRPPWSALECGRFAAAFGLQLPPWRNALQQALSA
jgi:dTDP-4-dehydrorhamnose reductase